MNRIDLDGRHAVVTGGAKGIGLAIVRRMLDSGAKVSVWDIDTDRLDAELARLGENVRGDGVDVTDPEAIEEGIGGAGTAFGDIGIFVNNAGAVGTLAKVWEQPVENWQRMLTLNLTSTFLCCRAIAPRMMAHGYGRIVNIASNAAKMGTPNNAPYAAAKAGVVSLTKTLAKEIAGSGVIVNAIAPGGANTELFDNLSDEYRDQIASAMPLGRLVEPDEVAAIACWAASEDCSFTTGAVFDISGGRADY
ncbi:MAG: SDR family oxidoreductase [Alphaproteobacteria bacterium]|nr:SDR family oxidoreductase [Alphaproteobacteria bacterium]